MPRSLYALRIIRAHGLAGNALFDVAQATTVAQLLYASPAWWGFLKTHEKNRLRGIVRKAQRSGFLPHSLKSLDELREESDETLFRSIRYNPIMSFITSYLHLKTLATISVRAHTTSPSTHL